MQTPFDHMNISCAGRLVTVTIRSSVAYIINAGLGEPCLENFPPSELTDLNVDI